MFASSSRMAGCNRTGTVARKTRKRSAGASRYGYARSHLTRQDYRKRRASAPILTVPKPTFIRVPSPVSRSAETMERAGLSVSTSPSPQPSPSKSVSFVAEVDEVFLSPRQDSMSLSVPRASGNSSGNSGTSITVSFNEGCFLVMVRIACCYG